MASFHALYLTLLWAASGSSLAAQTESGPTEPARQGESEARGETSYRDAHQAYESGDYGEALRLFADQQVEHPDDPSVRFNIGNAQYKGELFESATESFSASAASGESPDLRAAAFYNLGNTAYRQGRLEEAVKLYESALAVVPDDEDSKFNLEFVREEIRRRRQQNRQRSQQGDQQPEGQPDEQPGSENLPQGSSRSDEAPQQGQDEQQDRGPDSDDQPSNAAGAQNTSTITEAEAQRYLDALEEGRPERPARRAQRGQPEVDW